MKIEIYGKKWCSYCYKVKQLCKREKLDFLYKELNKDFTKQEFFEQFPDAKTFPQIIVDGKQIGGYSELAADSYPWLNAVLAGVAGAAGDDALAAGLMGEGVGALNLG